jgi:hypothetical protein
MDRNDAFGVGKQVKADGLARDLAAMAVDYQPLLGRVDVLADRLQLDASLLVPLTINRVLLFATN